MTVVKLDSTHVDAVKPLFMDATKHMGVPITNIATTHQTTAEAVKLRMLEVFTDNYLSGTTTNFHAFGYKEDDKITALISFYQSFEEPSWYYTIYRSSGDNKELLLVLDEVIKYNEEQGRFKFYTLVAKNHSRLLRRFHWSDYNNERYGYFDEYVVPAKTKCVYTNAFDLLFKRMMVETDSVVRCNYLKDEYRGEQLPIGGAI